MASAVGKHVFWIPTANYKEKSLKLAHSGSKIVHTEGNHFLLVLPSANLLSLRIGLKILHIITLIRFLHCAFPSPWCEIYKLECSSSQESLSARLMVDDPVWWEGFSTRWNRAQVESTRGLRGSLKWLPSLNLCKPVLGRFPCRRYF